MTFIPEHLFELIEYISERILTPPASLLTLLELVLEAVKATTEASSERSSSPERSLATEWILRLFVTCHASLVIHSAFLVI